MPKESDLYGADIPDVCSISHVTKETEETDGKRREFIGGPAYFFSLALKRLGTIVAVITKLAKDDLPILDELRKERIRICMGASRYTSSFETVYRRGFDERSLRVKSVASPFEFNDIKIWPKKFFHLSPMTTEDFDIEILRKISEKCKLVLDVGGFIRKVQGEKIRYVDWEDKEEGLACASILKVDKHEAETLTSRKDVKDMLRKLSACGPKEVMLTSSDGLYVYADGKFHFSPFMVEEIKGRPGRGDTCVAAYVHARLKSMPSLLACKFAAIATSLKLSYEGPFKGSEKQVMEIMKAQI